MTEKEVGPTQQHRVREDDIPQRIITIGPPQEAGMDIGLAKHLRSLGTYQSFIRSLTRYICTEYSFPDSVLGARDTAVDQDKGFSSSSRNKTKMSTINFYFSFRS